ncbi:hypothetical protein CVT25_013020 [Psilocybe cyanescens]|uniref:Uncharacterized protein n=1 Tax=Psilocybe cyanescens TaxID=93625 RepID=A0A409XLV4_PSICY|nr:hypothetical protein CVT25_013020 [Psilocybe cyanescens]
MAELEVVACSRFEKDWAMVLYMAWCGDALIPPSLSHSFETELCYCQRAEQDEETISRGKQAGVSPADSIRVQGLRVVGYRDVQVCVLATSSSEKSRADNHCGY